MLGNHELGNNEVSTRNEWDALHVGPQEKSGKNYENQNSERQQKKLLLMYLDDGKNLRDIISTPEVQMTDDMVEEACRKVANGEIDDNKKREILSSIDAPILHENNYESLAFKLNSKHEKRILGAFGGVGFYRWEDAGPSDLSAFRSEYPTPLDFDEISKSFVDSIGAHNGEKKKREYEIAMESFKKAVYGKQYEYWCRMKEIDSQVDEASGNKLKESQRYEYDRNWEWAPGDKGICQVSKNQVWMEKVTPEAVWSDEIVADTYCQDAYLSEESQQLYGVFDGNGGFVEARVAATTAKDVVHEACTRTVLDTPEKLAEALNAASNKVAENTHQNGATTGTLARIIKSREGNPSLIYATAGDSRIYVVDGNGKARMITKDEGFGRYLLNCLGDVEKPNPVVQHGSIPLKAGDKIVMCSDGITGDYGDDIMSDEKLGSTVHNSRNASEAAKNLMIESSKKDDRTAIVFMPDFERI